MPTINVFYGQADLYPELCKLTKSLKDFVARELTCGDIALKPEEVSVRLLQSRGDGMLAPLELEITAHAFKERVQKQDEICLSIRQFIKDQLPAGEVRVWLLLPKLGHSWE